MPLAPLGVVGTPRRYYRWRTSTCRWPSRAYSPLSARSSSCVPCSASWPCSRTQIRLALRTVESRWAITTVVRVHIILSSASCTNASDSVSRADVASSSSSTLGSAIIARAIATRCFCPPESWTPRSPTTVSYPSLKAEMKPCALAASAAATAAERAASGLP
mmetsp:Transcript_12657/g.32098  ORF Transcript_12657/g.32098 Transcript_12657/m.32098 type:complete len:162 (+) Transcript_12657:3-488(+)